MRNFINNIKYWNVKTRIAVIACIVLAIRVISTIPLPYINGLYLAYLKEGYLSEGIFGMMTGASFASMSLFALSVSPYITASIVMQLMSAAIPGLANMQKEGKKGEDKYKAVMALLGIAIAFSQSYLIARGMGYKGLIEPYTPKTVSACTALWTLGAAILILLGQFLENFNLGSGISWLLFANIISGIPRDLGNFYNLYVRGHKARDVMIACLVLAIAFATVTLVCTFMSQSFYNIHVTWSGKLSGMISKASSTFPISFMPCSVMPIIFAGTITGIPGIAMQISGRDNHILNEVASFLSPSRWFIPGRMHYTLGALIYVGLTYAFTFFYLMISLNGYEIAEKLKEGGGVIPGLHPGIETGRFLNKHITRMSLIGNTVLCAMVIGSHALANLTGFRAMAMGGTSMVIAITLLGETAGKIRAELASDIVLPSFAGAVRRRKKFLWMRI